MEGWAHVPPGWRRGPQLVSCQGLGLQAKAGLARAEGLRLPWDDSTQGVSLGERVSTLLQACQIEIHDVAVWAPMCLCSGGDRGGDSWPHFLD